jgi:hypothetical protein
MVRKAAGGLVVLGWAASMLAAEAVTQKFDWKPVNGIQDVHVETSRVVISQLGFDLGSTLQSTPIRRSSAKVIARVDNNGWLDQEVGIAVVVFDEEGNVVAAGSGGTKWGFLNKGDRDKYTIDFPYVYRRFDQAKTILVTLETKEKSGKQKSASKPTPTPSP